jgi:2-furoate---CoA ligase
MTLARLLDRAALRWPQAEALVDGATRLDWSALSRRAHAVAGGLARLGVGRGDRVLIVLRNRVEHVLTYWAAQTIGAVAVPVNFRLAAAELAYLVEDSGGALASFKRPRRVVFVREIPKTASGKILRRLLREGQYTEVTP